jgi:hypothetical protein
METTTQGRIGKLLRLLARLNANSEELPQLELSRARLAELLFLLQEAADRQALHTAAKQEASQEMRGFLVEAERLATVLQLGVKQHYGIRAEKLADFGLKPFRGRRKPIPPPEPPPELEALQLGSKAAPDTDPS